MDNPYLSFAPGCRFVLFPFLLHALVGVFFCFSASRPVGLFFFCASRSCGFVCAQYRGHPLAILVQVWWLLPPWLDFGASLQPVCGLAFGASLSCGFLLRFSASRSSGFGFRFSASRCCGFGLRLFCFTLLWVRFSSFLLQAPAALVFFPASHSCGFVLLFCSTLLWVCYFFLPHALVGLVFVFSASRSCLLLLRLFCFTLL